MQVHIRYGQRQVPKDVEVKHGDWILMLVDELEHRDMVAGTRCEFIPNYDVLLEGPYVFIIVEANTHRTIAVRLGGMAISAGVEALQRADAFAQAANTKLEPEDRMKTSMPLDPRKCRERFEERVRRNQGTKGEGQKGKEELEEKEWFYLSDNGLGMCPASAINEVRKTFLSGAKELPKPWCTTVVRGT